MAEAKKAEDLTVLVFKDGLASKTFQVSLPWLRRLLTLTALTLPFLVILLLFLVKNWGGGLRGADHSRIATLEKDNELLLAQVEQLKNTAVSQIAPTPGTDTTRPSEPESIRSQHNLSSPETHPFSAFPKTIRTFPNDRTIPIVIANLEMKWVDKKLRVNFYIHYSAKDGGPQQGRFILLAKGPSSLQTYPARVMNSAPDKGLPLIDPERGEYFSVSRFREVKAEFGPYDSRNELGTVQILILNKQNELMISDSIPVPAEKANSSP